MTAQISALPTPPSTNDPANFNTRADAFLGQMPTFVSQANVLANEVSANTAQVASDRIQTGVDRAAAAASAATALGAPGTNGTSTTSLTIGMGTRAFTTQAGKAWVAGQGFFLASSASPLNWMTGVLTAYNASTGAATLEVDTVGGSGVFSAWNCGLAAGRPLSVATQAQAESGSDTTSWMTPQRSAQSALAFGVPVGSIVQSIVNPGSRWLPCTGLIYLRSSYPALSAIIPPYVRPLVLRRSASYGGPVCYGGGVFVAWMNSVPFTSPDGIAWTQQNLSWVTPSKLVFGGGVFVAYYAGAIYTSSNGVSWVGRSISYNEIYSIAYGGGNWVFSAYYPPSSQYVAGVSSNGSTWVTTSGLSERFLVSAYDTGAARWISLGASSGYYSSDGGQTWSSFSYSVSSSPVSLIFGGGKFLLLTSNGGLFTSNDGKSGFTPLVSSPFQAGFATVIYYDGNNFLVLSSNDKLAISADLTNWTVMDGAIGSPNGFARASGSITSPYVFCSTQGVWSGLDTSPTEFASPTIVPAATNVNAYIKAA